MPISRVRLSLLGLLLPLFGAARAHSAENFFVWPVTVKIAAQSSVFRPNDPLDLVILQKIKNDDIINLATGQPLGAKVDKKTRILAAAATFEEKAGGTPLSHLIVFDPSQNGLAQVVTTVAKGGTLAYQSAYLGSVSNDVGAGSVPIQATTIGNFAQNGFLSTTLFGSGQGTGSHLAPPDFSPLGVKLKVKATLTGRLTFNFTKGGVAGQFDGFIVKGEAKVSGKPIGMFVE